jgi:hypothetical protein
MVLKAVRASAVCRRLLSVPGVGPIVALTYATGVDDPARFLRSRDIGPHFGLTPRKYASGEIDRNGSITKAGDGAVREVLVQAALTLLTRVHRWSALKAGVRLSPNAAVCVAPSLPWRANSRSSCTACRLTPRRSTGHGRPSPWHRASTWPNRFRAAERRPVGARFG